MTNETEEIEFEFYNKILTRARYSDSPRVHAINPKTGKAFCGSIPYDFDPVWENSENCATCPRCYKGIEHILKKRKDQKVKSNSK